LDVVWAKSDRLRTFKGKVTYYYDQKYGEPWRTSAQLAMLTTLSTTLERRYGERDRKPQDQ
jgi:hypothetical protein